MLTVSSGKSGKVYQVRERASQRIYTMKVLTKKVIVQKKKIVHALAQRDLLVRGAATKSPFISCLRFSFQTSTDLYLVTDFAGSYKLSQHLKREIVLPVDHAKFYLAELILVIEHLHAKGLDIHCFGSEDILLDRDGHVVFSMFQNLEKVSEEEEQEEGIPEECSEYMAPEAPYYTRTSIFWSLGVLAFEMICGWNPFYAEEKKQMLKNICYSNVQFPEIYVGAKEQIFINGLLNRDPRQRLGATRGTEDLKSHGFFLDVDWTALARKKIAPPPIAKYKPNVVHAYDETLSYLAATRSQFASLSTQSAPLGPSLQANFKGFTFVDDEPLHQHSNYTSTSKHLDYENPTHNTPKRINSDDRDDFIDGNFDVW